MAIGIPATCKYCVRAWLAGRTTGCTGHGSIRGQPLQALAQRPTPRLPCTATASGVGRTGVLSSVGLSTCGRPSMRLCPAILVLTAATTTTEDLGGKRRLLRGRKQMSGYVNSFKRRARGPDQQYRRCRSTVDSDSKSDSMFGQLESAQRVAGDDLAVHAQSAPSLLPRLSAIIVSHPPRRPRHPPTVRPSALLSSRVPLAAQDHPGVDRARRREEVRDPTLSDTRLV